MEKIKEMTQTETNNKITFISIVAAVIMLIIIGIYFIGYNAGFKAADKQFVIVDEINTRLIDSLRKRSDSLYNNISHDTRTIYKERIKTHRVYVNQTKIIKDEAYLRLDTAGRVAAFRWIRDSTDRFKSQ